ncbi:hypothetical protein [Rhodobacter ferrooxidans]|uniref:Uncharacterized protein n=1 Tax=Rhodobacter ferrooxidans TaxID=371731 RepID=C8RYV5_9RHOB|nr:hypothetical protein [Rhodobacter sp. SW2]EEW25912.1 conserved hypothetical protein [Rhodobacter sp. SW2]
MRIVYHLGAHCTDEERLLKCLLKNRGALSAQGIVVPGPARYRSLIRDTAITLKGTAASRDTQALVLDQIMDEDVAERLVLSWDGFLSFPQWVLKGSLYPSGGERLRAITQIFPEIDAEFHLAIRNPATFLPCLLKKLRGKSYAEFIEGSQPMDLRWSDLIENILARNPGVPLHVWCDEDTPLIWPEVLQSVSGHAPLTRLDDCDDLLASIMTEDGFRRMTGYLDSHAPQTVEQRRRIVSAFLDKFARPEQIDLELQMPGWTEDLVAAMTLQYEQDAAWIAQMPGVTFLAP